MAIAYLGASHKLLLDHLINAMKYCSPHETHSTSTYRTSVGDDIEAYICATKMDQLCSYGIDNEMLTLSHLLECNIYSYHYDGPTWQTLAHRYQHPCNQVNVHLLGKSKSF